MTTLFIRLRLNKILLALASVFALANTTFGQQEDSTSRTFMPTLQLGYVAQGTTELSGGLITQTSIEYRDISNFVFRINYDVINANMNVEYPIDTLLSFTGKTTISELIIGIGYRTRYDRHNLTAYVQPGLRFYGYPMFNSEPDGFNLAYDGRRLGVIRYSLGYEFELKPKLFLVFEGLLGQSFAKRDFWGKNQWSYGGTIGISAPL